MKRMIIIIILAVSFVGCNTPICINVNHEKTGLGGGFCINQGKSDDSGRIVAENEEGEEVVSFSWEDLKNYKDIFKGIFSKSQKGINEPQNMDELIQLLNAKKKEKR